MWHTSKGLVHKQEAVLLLQSMWSTCVLCVCVVWKVPSHKHIHCLYSAKDKDHPDLNKNIHIWTVSFIKPAYCAQAYLYTPICRACKVSFLLMLKHGPRQALILSQTLSLSFSPFIFFPPSRCFQLQETDVSSCLTSRLNFFALLCFFLEWQPLSRGTSAMTNTHRFKVTLFPSNRSLYYAPPRSLCTLVKVMAPICKDCFWAWQGHMSGGGGVIAGFQCPSRRWWCWTMKRE